MKRNLSIALLCVLLVIALCSCNCEHEWKDATCDKPRTCTKCGATEGEPLDHIWREATCTKPKTCIKCNVEEGFPLEHEWEDATCSKPKTCAICGMTEGNTLNHTWKEATCDTPKTCSVCGATEGKSLGHTFDKSVTKTEATCSKAGNKIEICSVCGFEQTTSIPKLAHKPGDWVIEKEATINEKGVKKQYCTVCGAEIASESIEIDESQKETLYKQACQKANYIDLARSPDVLKGQKVKVSGKVIQVIEASSSQYYCVYRVDITHHGDASTYSIEYYDDTILVLYDGYGKPVRILEDDIITIYGEYQGLDSYESVLGATITLPKIFAEYIDIN